MTFQPFVLSGKASAVFRLIALKAQMEKDAEEQRRNTHRLNSARIVDKFFHDCREKPGAGRCNTPCGFDCEYADCPVIKILEEPREICHFKENTTCPVPNKAPCSKSGCAVWKELFSDLEVR